MLNIAEYGNHKAGHSELKHPHTPNLIMRWIDKCTDPAAPRVNDGLTVATNSVSHRDQLVAVWIELGATPPRTVS